MKLKKSRLAAAAVCSMFEVLAPFADAQFTDTFDGGNGIEIHSADCTFYTRYDVLSDGEDSGANGGSPNILWGAYFIIDDGRAISPDDAAGERLTSGGEPSPDHDGDGIPDSKDDDADGDQIPNKVEDSHGLNALDASDAHEDLDGDGDSNLDEFIGGSRIDDPSSRFGIRRIARLADSGRPGDRGGTGKMTFDIIPSRTYIVRMSVDTRNWFEIGRLSTSTDSKAGIAEIRFPFVHASQFFKIEPQLNRTVVDQENRAEDPEPHAVPAATLLLPYFEVGSNPEPDAVPAATLLLPYFEVGLNPESDAVPAATLLLPYFEVRYPTQNT